MNTADTLIADAPNDSSNSPASAFAGINHNQSLRDCVDQAMDNYFKHLDGQGVTDVYDMVMAEVEAPMLEVVMKYTRHNQTKAAQVLGLNRGTLRKKLKQYGLL
ncbi:DNA-binding transcriptional regulator Fis [Exilibacterium tricleocarpae]|uniref:Putative Fis-like DNA-binding protein n=1 Tax=Exilibacterium tricleocarpae TaxID=2591008 RepID=A0A545T3C9_9GAMM|nr:DNA-binding transcriptional regulator Fis [Exilibacterium tricleocarpae]TQV71731.1 DNA-binding transcriptional regulator Fis [Exilibacterium tricleocarpae]